MKDYLQTLPQFILPKRLLTLLLGLGADIQIRCIKNFIIHQFIKQYGVNMQEACLSNPADYHSFNDFFIRHLRPDVRQKASTQLICPVDGSVSQIGAITAGRLIQAKKKAYTVQALLGGSLEEAAPFQHGQFATLYLSPKDYHRIHMPIDGQIQQMRYVPGKLFSVQPSTTRVIPQLFAQNERVVIWLKTALGPMVMVFVGATIVGTIATSWHGEFTRDSRAQSFTYDKNPPSLSQGDEMGYFKLGSTVIVLFAPEHPCPWSSTLTAGSLVRLFQALSEH